MNAPVSFAAQFHAAQDAKAFCLAGNAHITIRSVATSVRYTFRVRRIEHEAKWFVSLLTGSSNEVSYSYTGLLVEEYAGFFRLRLTTKSKLTDDSIPVRAFRFFVEKVLNVSVLPEALEVFHEGRCGRCARLLTVPESIERGIGPDCAKFMEAGI